MTSLDKSSLYLLHLDAEICFTSGMNQSTDIQTSRIQINLPNTSAVIDCASVLCSNASGLRLREYSLIQNGSNLIAHLKYSQSREDTLVIMHIINNLIFIKPLYALW